MAKLEDYGIRIINHGEWSDPEVKWKKSDYQTLLFNYWDCVECFENDKYDFSNDEDLELFAQNLWELTPSEYDCPSIYYEWEVSWHDEDFNYYSYDDCDFYKDNKTTPKKDFVLHNSSQALAQALTYLDDNGLRNAEIVIYRHDYCGREVVANYSLQGSTLKNHTSYKKCA